MERRDVMVSAEEDIRFLIQIVQKDNELLKIKKFLEIAPARIDVLDKEIAKMDDELTAHLETISSLEAEKKNLEDNIKKQTENITQKKLDREKLNTNKEYKAMGHEIEYLIGQIDKEEERILQILDQITAMTRELEKIQEKIDSEKGNLLESKNKLEMQMKNDKDRLALLEDEKVRIFPHLSKRIRQLYQRIAKAKGDSGVANLAGDICQGCYSRVPPQKAHEIRRNDTILTCEVCGRILVFYPVE